MFELIYRRIEGFIKSTISRIATMLGKFRRLPLLIAKKAKDLLRDIINFIIRKPSDLSDYIKLGGSYVAKRALLAWVLLAAAIVLCIFWFVVPFLSSTFFTSKLVVNTPQFHTASGKAEVYTESGALLYSGVLKDGKANGDGKLYKDGSLVYQGEFADNEYNGMGRLYNEYGALVYSGEFANSLYNGTGSEYYPNGSLKVTGTYVAGMLEGEAPLYSEDKELIYSGGFSAGKFDGKGELYEDGQLVYKGDFVNGEKTGESTIYDNGELVYSGGILAGKFNGKGELYEDGQLVYKGEFVNGEKTGESTIYDNGELIYSGGMLSDKYSGEGILYNYKTDMRLEGVFEDGYANGNALLYSSDGELLYNGNMLKGEIPYLSYASADRQEVERSFTEKAVVRELDEKSVVHYPQLGVGFIFDADSKTDRIVITGEQQLLNASVGALQSEFNVPEGAVKYNEYSFSPTKYDTKQFSYLGIQPPKLLDTVKYIRDNVFLKLYYSGGRLLFYEIGVV